MVWSCLAACYLRAYWMRWVKSWWEEEGYWAWEGAGWGQWVLTWKQKVLEEVCSIVIKLIQNLPLSCHPHRVPF